MRRCRYNVILAAFMVASILCPLVVPQPVGAGWAISGDVVYTDSADAFIAVTPHTLGASGWAEVMFYTKSYSGPIDIVAGFEGTDGVQVKDVQIYEGGSWIKSGTIVESKVSFVGCEVWQTSSLGNAIQPLTYYTARLWIDIPAGASGKYAVGLKAVGLPIVGAWLLDPWYNATKSPVEFPVGEIVQLRQENSKTIYLGQGKFALETVVGAIHYKDNYNDPSEQWKDIDLTWVDNKITKAPYELTLEGNKITVRDKKTGDISTIELLEVGGASVPVQAWEHSKGLAKVFDTDIEIVAGNSQISFTRILKSDRAPKEAKYRVTGNIPLIVSARDAETGLLGNELPVEWTLKDNILTETLKPDRPVKYPVRIDPTLDLQVGASVDDCYARLEDSYFSVLEGIWVVGRYFVNPPDYDYGGAGRFINVTIPQGSTISTAYLTLRCFESANVTTVNSRISADDADDAVAPTSFAEYEAKWNGRTTARVDWDNIGAWTLNADYNSPEIKTVIQEIVDRGSWASGNALQLFWEDHEQRSTQGVATQRKAYSYDGSAINAPKLHIEYTPPPPTVTADAASGVEETTVTLSGNVTVINDTAITQRGFVYGTTSNNTLPNSSEPPPASYDSHWLESGSWPVGTFTSSGNITGLSAGTCYYYRATANNTLGYWGYSGETVFHTKPEAPTNLVCTPGDATCSHTWTKGTGSENTTIWYQAGSYPPNRGVGTETYDDTGNSDTTAGLVNGTTYYFVAWASSTCGATTQYSDATANCTCTPAGAPLVQTQLCSGFGEDWAVVNGEVIGMEGAASITQRGFDYGLTAAYGSTALDAGVWGTGAFSEFLGGLSPGTVYHYRARALNNLGLWGYGQDKLLATKGSPVPYEYWNAACAGTGIDIYANNWAYQTFTTFNTTMGVSHSISSVYLDLERTGLPGDLSVSIRRASGNVTHGEPTGVDIMTGSIDADAIETTPTWYKVDMTPETYLSANATYAIVTRALSGTAAAYVNWSLDTVAGYADGNAGRTADGSVTWSSNSTVDYCFEIWGDPAMEVEDAKVFSGYLATDDWIIVARYNNFYPPYYDGDDVRQRFVVQLADSGTVLAQVSCPAWGYGPVGIYISEGDAASLEWGRDYRVRVYGNVVGSPYVEYSIQGEDWRGTDLLGLDRWCLTTAHLMEDYYGVALTTSVGAKGEVLNEEGGVVFDNGISGLPYVRPDLFLVMMATTPYKQEAGVITYAPAWQSVMGTYFTEAFTNMGNALGGIGGKAYGGFLFFGFAALIGLTGVARGHAMMGVIIVLAWLPFGTWLGLVFPAVLAVAVAIAALMLVFQLWFKGA